MSKSAALIEKRLDEYKAKPLLPLELPTLLARFDDPKTSLESFKSEYLRDPIFCWELISAAYEATRNRASHPYAADHAMSIVGLGNAAQRFKNLPITQQSQLLSDEVSFSLSVSLLAAELTRQISNSAGNSVNHQAYWTALCYQLPDTLLWYLQPRHMWRIYYRRLTIPKRLHLFEESKLGFNLHDWRIAAAERFHLSEQNRILFSKPLPQNPKELFAYAKHGFSEQTPSLIDWHRYEGWLVVLANRLAMAILIPWHHSSFRHLVKLIQQLARCDNKKLNRAINESIRTVSINLKGSQLPLPAVGHLLLNGRPQFPEWLVKPDLQPPPKRSVAKVPSSTLKAPAKLAKTIDHLVNQAASFESSSMLVHYGLKALIDELKLSRASFLTVDFEQQKVLTRIALNQSGSEKIRPDFDFKIPTPLQTFIDKQTFMLFSRQQHQRLWKAMPMAVQKAQVEQFVLCSLKPGKRVRAIIYADAADPAMLSEQRIKLVKKLLSAINKGLIARNQAKTSAAAKTSRKA